MEQNEKDCNCLLPIKDCRIEPDLINHFEIISFKGEISVISSEDELFSAMDFLSTNKLIGFDTESRPAFLKGQKFPVSVIQMAVEDHAFIFQLKKMGFHPVLRDILSNPSIQKIGVGVHDDIKRLQDMNDFNPAGFIDLSVIAKNKGLIQTGIRALTARYLGKKVVKSSQKTNWSRMNLSERQLRYASTDAWVCLRLIDPLCLDNTDYFAMRQEQDAGE